MYKDPNIDQVLQVIRNDIPQRDFLFKKLASSGNPIPWLEPLFREGYFAPENNPSPQKVPDKEGYFKSKLYPGSYNVTVTHMVNESGIDVLYVFERQITIQVGEVSKSYEILLDKGELI